MPQAMTDEEVREALAGLPGWSAGAGALTKELSFDGFSAAFAFLTRVALLAEKRGHHPDFHCSYSRVRLELRSHDAGGVTARDVELARAIEALLPSPARPGEA